MGMAPLKSRPPSRNDKDKVTALARTGVMTYARGARVCAMAICPQHSTMQTRIRERASGVIAELLRKNAHQLDVARSGSPGGSAEGLSFTGTTALEKIAVPGPSSTYSPGDSISSPLRS